MLERWPGKRCSFPVSPVTPESFEALVLTPDYVPSEFLDRKGGAEGALPGDLRTHHALGPSTTGMGERPPARDNLLRRPYSSLITEFVVNMPYTDVLTLLNGPLGHRSLALPGCKYLHSPAYESIGWRRWKRGPHNNKIPIQCQGAPESIRITLHAIDQDFLQ